MKKHIKNILAYLLGTIGVIALVLFASALYGYLIEREGKIAILIASGSIILILIILGFITWKDIPFLKKMGSR